MGLPSRLCKFATRYLRVLALARGFRNKLFTLLVPSHWGKVFSLYEGGAFAAFAP